MTCQLCENRPATLDHLADGRHFLICEECYLPNGCPPRLIAQVPVGSTS